MVKYMVIWLNNEIVNIWLNGYRCIWLNNEIVIFVGQNLWSVLNFI